VAAIADNLRMPPQLLSINVGRPRLVPRGDGTVLSAIWKEPVSGPVAARGVNLDGDDQADRSVHGGVDKAIYAYAREDAAWWEAQLETSLGPGAFGENLTVAGIDLSEMEVGQRWRVGSAMLEISEPRLPCFKLGLRFGDPKMVRLFALAGRTGTYLRIVEEGVLEAGDAIAVGPAPGHGVTVATIAAAVLRDHSLAARMLEAPQLSEHWREWAQERAAA
jgi:MOSC domain-containing protein YiiM